MAGRGRIVNVSPYTAGAQQRIMKKNPWLSGKLASIARMGLARVKKDVVLAVPPPWFQNPDALSPRQKEINRRFTEIVQRYRGPGSLRPRIEALKRELGRQRITAGATAPP